MQDYKNNKILELKKEMVKVSGQNKYEINGIDDSRALFFYRKEKEKFKILPRGSYSILTEATNKYLNITDSSILNEAIEFQVCYLFIKTSSSYVDPFPELERLQEHYNELYSDFNNLLQQLESNNIVGDTMKMAYVLPQLDEGQVWVLRQGEMKAENIFDLDERLREAYEEFERVFDNWIQTEKKPEITQFVNGEKDRVLQDIETKKTQSIDEIDSHTTDKIAEIEAEGLSQKNQVTQEGTKQVGLVTAEGNKQVQRVTETGNTKVTEITQEGNNQVANVENEGETQYNRVKTEGDTQYNKIISTGIDAKLDKGTYGGNAGDLKNEIDTKLDKNDAWYAQNPIGSIVAFPSDSIPLGWLLCNGQMITQSEYPELYALIGPKVPDLRGQFLRGNDNGRGIDTGRVLLSEQEDEIRSHNHDLGLPLANAYSDSFWPNQNIFSRGQSKAGTAPYSVASTGGRETRPKNVSVNWCIKAKNVVNPTTAVDVAEELKNLLNNKIDKSLLNDEIFTKTNSPVLKSPEGYQKLGSGWIMQWGRSYLTDPRGWRNNIYPIAFPNRMVSVVCTPVCPTSSAQSPSVQIRFDSDNTSFLWYIPNATNQWSVYWIAIGY